VSGVRAVSIVRQIGTLGRLTIPEEIRPYQPGDLVQIYADIKKGEIIIEKLDSGKTINKDL
jgi:bifunctional DNA-binding transcriptional regulator/antitoxin component of YhaV-PrlF toxin-antitoxin module